jgi:hypothetical protein
LLRDSSPAAENAGITEDSRNSARIGASRTAIDFADKAWDSFHRLGRS